MAMCRRSTYGKKTNGHMRGYAFMQLTSYPDAAKGLEDQFEIPTSLFNSSSLSTLFWLLFSYNITHTHICTLTQAHIHTHTHTHCFSMVPITLPPPSLPLTQYSVYWWHRAERQASCRRLSGPEIYEASLQRSVETEDEKQDMQEQLEDREYDAEVKMSGEEEGEGEGEFESNVSGSELGGGGGGVTLLTF